MEDLAGESYCYLEPPQTFLTLAGMKKFEANNEVFLDLIILDAQLW